MTASAATESSGTLAVWVGELEGDWVGVLEDVEVEDDSGVLVLDEVWTTPFVTVALIGWEVSPEPGAA